MRRPLRNLVAFMALGTGLSACSLLVDFDEEGQPCDERFQCLEGYTCVDNACVPEGSTPPDGGTDAGSDGALAPMRAPTMPARTRAPTSTPTRGAPRTRGQGPFWSRSFRLSDLEPGPSWAPANPGD